jgi:pentatricopeptide repeat protein
MILNMKDTTDDATVALSLFEESQRLGVRPNVYLFNTLISKLSRARRAKEALEYFELMKQYSIVPTSITYGAIINACCKIGDDVAADHLFNEMVTRPDFKPRVPPYNTMIQHFVSTKPDRKRALHYYDLLVKARVAPTAHTYKLLLDAYGATGDVPDLEAMQQVFTRLTREKHVSVSGAHWAALITAYGLTAKDTDRAITIFESIATHPTSHKNPNGALPDAVVYEALLNALIANGRADLSDKYLAEMRDKGVRMTAYVANTLIKVCFSILLPSFLLR